MMWHESYRADPRARPLADRHYNRQKIGAVQFVPPGTCLVLLTAAADALWITSWPKAEFVRHRWAGAWINSTFVDAAEVASPNPGCCYRLAGFRRERCCCPPGRAPCAGKVCGGRTKDKGLLAFRLRPEDMPPAAAPVGAQFDLVGGRTA